MGVRSYWRWDIVTLQVADHVALRWIGVHGSAVLAVGEMHTNWNARFEWVYREPDSIGPTFMRFGFYIYHGPGTWAVGFPYWFAGMVLLLAAWGIWRWSRRRKPARAGKCGNCGYDLRATPEGGRELLAVCPECGNVTAVVKGA
jgi:predicted RNA-binding Zn-ribbon protein involved in translation (DUF1610 family)